MWQFNLHYFRFVPHAMKLGKPSLRALVFIVILVYCIITIYKAPTLEQWFSNSEIPPPSSFYQFCSVDKVYRMDFPLYNFTWWVYGVDAETNYDQTTFMSATEGILIFFPTKYIILQKIN